MDGPSLFEGLYLVKVGVPDLSGLVIGVTYIVSKDRTFSTEFADFCHDQTSIFV